MQSIIFPPRPKGKMLPNDLPYYEQTGKWLAQRKFRGSRAVIYISADRKASIYNRHGREFAKFKLDRAYQREFVDNLNLQAGKDYWLDGELMNKDVNATNEIILFDVLHVGKYLFNSPNQIERLDLLNHICNFPTNLCEKGFALKVTPRIWLAETFFSNFVDHFKESLEVPQLEGLVLRKKLAGLDDWGTSEYTTTNLIRCRKPFSVENPKEGRSGGYEF